jgi:hypothetical protein
MRFYFHEEAEAEFDKAVAYYEECQRGLGLDFAREVYEAINHIVQFPDAWARVSTIVRRCLVKRFPFGILYRVEKDAIEIVAIADLRRRPDYWKHR